MHTLIDIGANLTNKAFRRDLDRVVARAAEAGVRRIVVTGTSEEASRAARDLAAERPGQLFATAGVHPRHASTFGEGALRTLRELAAAREVVALGECGLDFNRNFSTPEDQVRCFEAQLMLAGETRLPLFLHERDAHETFVEILERFRGAYTRAVVHCFTGSERELDRYLSLGLYIGITGWICDERRGRHLRDIVGRVPLDRLMVETDAPYLLPRDLPKRPGDGRNEPAFLPHIVASIAGCRGEPVEAVAEATTRAAMTFFELSEPTAPPASAHGT